MSLLADALSTTKKILLVSEEIDRLSEDCKALSKAVADHEHRLIRIETIIEIARSGSHLTLPG